MSSVVVWSVKSYGDGGVATGAGGGYRWKCLATNLHVGDLGVMAALCRPGATAKFVSCLGGRAAPFRESAALFE